MVSTACGPKVTKINEPIKVAQAREATFDELINLVNERYASSVRTLQVASLRVKAEGVERDKGLLKQYPRGSGYVILRRPASVHFNINNPLTHTTIADMASDGNLFQIFIPSENKFIQGSTSVKRTESNPFYNIRPNHVVNAFLIEPLPASADGGQIYLKETQDAQAKYYVLGVIGAAGAGRAFLKREIFIERSQMVVDRQVYYEENGAPLSLIRYRGWNASSPGVATFIELDRPGDGYKLTFELDPGSIQINPEVETAAFVLNRPNGAELVEVKEKF